MTPWPACFYRRLLIAVTLAWGLAGCAAPDPMLAALRDGHPAPGTARVVLYYPAKLLGSDGLVQVAFADERSCKLPAGSYMVRELKPGMQNAAVSFCGSAAISYLHLRTAAGKTYFVRITPYDSSVTGIISGYPGEYVAEEDPHKHKGPFALERMEGAAALSDLESLKYSQ